MQTRLNGVTATYSFIIHIDSIRFDSCVCVCVFSNKMGRFAVTLIVMVFFNIAKLTTVVADDNNILLYNSIEHCKSNEYFDVNYFICKACDANLYLARATDGEFYFFQSQFLFPIILNVGHLAAIHLSMWSATCDLVLTVTIID